MITLENIWNLFLPVIKMLMGFWDFLNTGVYDAWYSIMSKFTILKVLYKPIFDFIENNTGIDDFLNQYTVFTISLVGGLSVVIILSIVGFFTDKIGL